MQSNSSHSLSPEQHLHAAICTRYTALIWACLDADLARSAVFYAERFSAIESSNARHTHLGQYGHHNQPGHPNYPGPPLQLHSHPNAVQYPYHVDHSGSPHPLSQTVQFIHPARHLHSRALLHAGQPHSALHVLDRDGELARRRCAECEQIRGQCLEKLGRWREAKDALENSVNAGVMNGQAGPSRLPVSSRMTISFPEEAVLHCRTGMMAMKAKQYEVANTSFRRALVLNPMLWEALEGLCALGTIPVIHGLFPPRPQPIKRGPGEVSNLPSISNPPHPAATPMTNGHGLQPFTSGIPAATGMGFFTPSPGAGSFPNVFKPAWGQESGPSQPFRIDPIALQRYNDTPSFSANNSLGFSQQQPLLRLQRYGSINGFQPSLLGPGLSTPIGTIPPSLGMQPPPRALVVSSVSTQLIPSNPAPLARPLSSAEETGPAPKKPRSTARKTVADIKAANGEDDAAKKGRTRSRSGATGPVAVNGKNDREPPARRSTRLLGGTSRSNVKSPDRNRRRTATQTQPQTHGRAMSHESQSELAEDTAVDSASSPIPLSEGSPVPTLPGLPSRSSTASSLVSAPAHSQTQTAPTGPVWTADEEKTATDEYWAAMADNAVYDLMRHFAEATRALALFDVGECVSVLDRLPVVHQRSPWAMIMLGKAHYEKTEYAEAERAFNAVRQIQPYRIWDMEVFSTLLWYQQKPVQLSFLAQELLAIDARAPEAWIAVGNTFSAQRERAQALTAFRRAIQLDPGCAYAHTLMGHESVDEDPDQAMTYFQAALRADPRHYNAWYGLGSMYMKRNKMRLAEYHYRKALDINGNNAVILGCMGIACQRRGDRSGALVLFDDAIKRAPGNALVRYHRAKLYITMRQYKKAVVDLERLRDNAPEESNVVFQLAKVYRLLGDELKSAQLLAAARDISPKSIGKIRKLLETVKDEEADEQMDEG